MVPCRRLFTPFSYFFSLWQLFCVLFKWVLLFKKSIRDILKSQSKAFFLVSIPHSNTTCHETNGFPAALQLLDFLQ